MKTYGCAKWSSKPYTDYGLFDPNNMNTEKEKYAAEPIAESIHEEARKYRVGEKTEFYSLSEVKQALTAGPVIFSIFQYDASHLRNNPSPEKNYLIYDSTKGGRTCYFMRGI